MALWSTTEKFDHQLNGYPVSRDGALVAIAVYSGGTELARKNAELAHCCQKRAHGSSVGTSCGRMASAPPAPYSTVWTA